MAKRSTLFALLEKENEPTRKLYKETVDDVIKDPKQMRVLIEDDVRDDILILLMTRSHRLSDFFRHLRSVVRQMAKSSTASIIAADSVEIIIGILPYLHQLLETTKVLDILVPALDICLTLSQRPPLRELASLLSSSSTLLEHLVSEHPGAEIVRQWVSMQSTCALDAETLSLWTERLMTMVHNCITYHDITTETQQWHMLKALKTSLSNLEQDTPSSSGKRYAPATRHELPALSSMTQLSREDKKSRLVTHEETNNNIPSLHDDDKRSLKAFDIHVPGSKSAVLDAIKLLEGEKTTAILLSIVSKLPCYLCTVSLESPSRFSKGEIHDESFQAASILHLEVRDKGIGVWKVILSPKALRSLLHLGSHGMDDSTAEKIIGIASGCWDPKDQPLAGSKHQKMRLKVPIAKTKCGQNHFILWQITIGMDEDMEVRQQEITVWEVCEYGEILKIVDQVVFLQQSYSDEFISRCRHHPSVVDGIQIPARFDDTSSHPVKSTRPSADLDVRTVDQDLIAMTNKFYALTEPMIRAILSNDITAEFRFNLSREEAHVIRHFRTASLILGRSGTGKTTCLVFKLISKYLASKAVGDQKPARQVLLTRSSFLVDKLSSYTRRLIETLLAKPADLDSSQPRQPSEHMLSITPEDLEQSTVFSLRDASFPLVCTWESFLRILENTAAKFDSQRLYDLREPTYHRSDEVANTRHSAFGQLVDFDTFKFDYWPHFSHSLTKGLSIHLVFAEIMGVIKGSASSRETLQPLRQEEYLNRSCRLAPTFESDTERSRVYEIFGLYEKMKLELGGVDFVDRVVKLIRAVRRDSSLYQLLQVTFDEVYIDEIQDQRCLDIELLLSFVRNGRGFHFAGDTAQAISQESTFRFSDIKALFYEHFATASATSLQSELSRPKMFTLSENYRSHQGILALASLVMGMIWKGFPETVDKLDPEIGHLNGPRPVLFCGVDSNILRPKDVSHLTPSAGTADFGAEQVILVRDARMKSSLRDEIGDVALILTILESKGMEFDDVILWNFFTECPDQAGVRSLKSLEREPSKFDPKRHGSMCSELKNLYVAITRARVQLFIMESSQDTAMTVLNVLGNDTLGSLVHITSPSHEDFAMRLELLRPGTSLDPRQWSQRGAEFLRVGMYKDALMCFRKAHNVDGETTAEGHRLELAARDCNANNDAEGLTQNLALALECFSKVQLSDDAARVLVALGRPEDAAETLFQCGKFSKAARLFVEAGLSTRAINCHDLAKEYSEAAAIMNKERDYDRLVSYLDQKRGSIPANVLQGYGLLCKLLLKQNRTSSECRKHAIRLLGSSADQEKCFVEYGMDEELAELYATQLRYIDLLHLYSKKGQLEPALRLAITKDLLQSTEDYLETEITYLLDYVWVAHMQSNKRQPSTAPFKLPSGFCTPRIILRAEQWEACNLLNSLESSIARQHFASMKSSVPKTVSCLRNILNRTAITDCRTLDELPFEMMQEAINFARDLTLDRDGIALDIVLLLTGLWKPASEKGRLIVLPWSPLRESLANVSDTDLTKVVTQRVLDGLVSAILALDTKARTLWTEKWPKRCVQFVTIGFCPRQRRGEPCNRILQAMSMQDCFHTTKDLLRVNGIFYELAMMYYRRAMNETFQGSYLGIKRHWLERLLRELTFLSAVEQHASTIRKTQAKLCYDKKYIAILSSLEELLYYRLVKEWRDRSDFTSLLEQTQLATALGSKLQNRLFRALSHKLLTDQRDLMQHHLGLLNLLKENLVCWNASFFQEKLATFLRNFDNITVSELSTLHSLTAVVEYFAANLILRTCAAACVVPKSWIDLHITSTSRANISPKPLQEDDKHRYQGCLLQLAKCFGRVLNRLEKAELDKDFLYCSGVRHPPQLLRQRNAELVAVLIANLAAASPAPPIGFNEVWARAKEVGISKINLPYHSLMLLIQVFEYDFIKTFHLISRTPDELIQRLAASLAKYNGKDALVIVVRDRKKGSKFLNLEHQPGVETILFDQLCLPAPSSAADNLSADSIALSTSADEASGPEDQYSAAETKAIAKIQRKWRSILISIKKRRSYAITPEGRATARFSNLSADIVGIGVRKAMRELLLSHGVSLCLGLGAARESLSRLQKDAMACIENVDISHGIDKSVDDILCRNRNVESLLGKAEEKMFDEYLVALLKQGVPSVLEKALKDVEDAVVDVQRRMSETGKMIDAVSRNCT